MEKIGVGIGAVILDDNKVLLVKHKKETPWKGYWIIPGGKLEVGETLEECLKREIMEEVGIEIEIGKIVEAHISFETLRGRTYKHKWLVLMSFLTKPEGNKIRIRENELEDAKWFLIGELSKLKIHPDSILPLKLAGYLKE